MTLTGAILHVKRYGAQVTSLVVRKEHHQIPTTEISNI